MPNGAKPTGPLPRAFEWKTLLESGKFAIIAELARREKIHPLYLTQILRLTLLAPEIVERIVEGRQAAEITLARLMEPVPPEWKKQR